MILTGRNVAGRKALKLGLVDALLPEARFLDQVRDFARERIDKKKREAGGRRDRLQGAAPGAQPAGPQGGVRPGAQEDAGSRPAATIRRRCGRSRWCASASRTGCAPASTPRRAPSPSSPRRRISKNLVHVFHLMEAAKRETGLPGGEPRAGPAGGRARRRRHGRRHRPARRRRGGPAGAHEGRPPRGPGERHGARRGPVRPARSSGAAWSAPAARRKMALLQPTLDYTGFAALRPGHRGDRREARGQAGRLRRAGARTCRRRRSSPRTPRRCRSRRSARRRPHPERVVGMHFFNPVHKMPLVEVIAPAGSGPVGGEHRLRLRPQAGQDAGPGQGRARLPGQPPAELLLGRGALAARRGVPDRGHRPGDDRLGHADGPDGADRRGGDRRVHQGGPHPPRGVRRPPALPRLARPRAGQRPARHQERQGLLPLRREGAEGAGPGGLQPARPAAEGERSRSGPDRGPHGAAHGQRGGPLPGGGDRADAPASSTSR